MLKCFSLIEIFSMNSARWHSLQLYIVVHTYFISFSNNNHDIHFSKLMLNIENMSQTLSKLKLSSHFHRFNPLMQLNKSWTFLTHYVALMHSLITTPKFFIPFFKSLLQLNKKVDKKNCSIPFIIRNFLLPLC
jgi:hypothetical protein